MQRPVTVFAYMKTALGVTIVGYKQFLLHAIADSFMAYRNISSHIQSKLNKLIGRYNHMNMIRLHTAPEHGSPVRGSFSLISSNLITSQLRCKSPVVASAQYPDWTNIQELYSYCIWK